MFQSNTQVAERVGAIMAALETLSPGETISYARLSEVAGIRITGASYILQRALAKSEKATGAVYANVMGQGYQRLVARDMPGVGKRANDRIRRTARKTRKRFENVRANDVTPAERLQLAAYRTHFGMVENIANERSVKSLSKEIGKPAGVEVIAGRLGELWGKS